MVVRRSFVALLELGVIDGLLRPPDVVCAGHPSAGIVLGVSRMLGDEKSCRRLEDRHRSSSLPAVQIL